VTSPVPVLSGLAGYQAAIAELPLHTREAQDAAGAVVVIAGDAPWGDGVRRAAAAGARAVIVSRPAAVPAADIRALRAELGSLPIIVERLLLRSDAASDVAAARAVTGSSEVRLIVVDAAAPVAEAGVVLRDAIAWARVLSGGALAWHAASGGLALSDGRESGDVPVALSVIEVDAGASWIRAQALGEVRSELGATAGRAVISTTGEHGAVVAPTRFETPQRLALRRAIAALESGEEPPDLEELATDAALAERLTGDGLL
jgi:hypothetical protein